MIGRGGLNRFSDFNTNNENSPIPWGSIRNLVQYENYNNIRLFKYLSSLDQYAIVIPKGIPYLPKEIVMEIVKHLEFESSTLKRVLFFWFSQLLVDLKFVQTWITRAEFPKVDYSKGSNMSELGLFQFRRVIDWKEFCQEPKKCLDNSSILKRLVDYIPWELFCKTQILGEETILFILDLGLSNTPELLKIIQENQVINTVWAIDILFRKLDFDLLVISQELSPSTLDYYNHLFDTSLVFKHQTLDTLTLQRYIDGGLTKELTKTMIETQKLNHTQMAFFLTTFPDELVRYQVLPDYLYTSALDFTIVSRFQDKLTPALIEKFKNVLDWTFISEHWINLSDKFLETYGHYMNFPAYQKRVAMTREFAMRHEKYLDKTLLSRQMRLPSKILFKYRDQIDWEYNKNTFGIEKSDYY